MIVLCFLLLGRPQTLLLVHSDLIIQLVGGTEGLVLAEPLTVALGVPHLR